MRLRRIAGAAVAVAAVAGGGLLLSSPTDAATTPTPITLDAAGMSSTSCPVPPLGVYGSIAVKPDTTVQFKPGTLNAVTTESLTIKPAPNSTDPASSATMGIPTAGTSPITFARATTYALSWQIKTISPLGVVSVLASQSGKLVITSNVSNCQVAVQVPVPSVSASVVPSPITSAINGAISSAASAVNSGIGPVNSALPSVPALPEVPGPPGTGSSPGTTLPPGADVPGTSYRPSGPTVADRTVPKGYGNGSGRGGVYVPSTGSSAIDAGGQQQAGTGTQAGNRSASAGVKSGGSPRTVELATSRPRSALGALPTLTVILAILALSGATAFYARTFLLQPVESAARVPAEPRT